MSEANIAIVRRWFGEIYNKKDLGLMNELHVESFVWRGPRGVTVTRRDGMREMIELYVAAFPDIHFTVED